MAAGSSPVVTAGYRRGRLRTAWAQPDSIYNWTAHPFNWNATDFQKIIFQQDFKSDGSGHFDDDR